MKKVIISLSVIFAFCSLTAQTGNTLSDIDGNQYPVVRIGTEEWMAENLRTTKFSDGTPIPMFKEITSWGNAFSPAYCWYNNEEEKNKFGALYNWFAVSTGKLCPDGWHVPGDDEWSQMTEYLGGTTIAGGKLKSTGADAVNEVISESELDKEKPGYVPGDEKASGLPAEEYKASAKWNSPNAGASNETGFKALPGGHRMKRTPSGFDNMGKYGYWWTSTEASPGVAWYRLLYYNHSHISKMTIGKTDGHSVRCVRDQAAQAITN